MNEKAIIAAVDNSSAAAPVIAGALALAPIFDARVTVVHVHEDEGHTASSAAAAAGLEVRELRGPTIPALVDVVGEASVVLGVLGARRTSTGRRPVGRTALAVIEAARKPIAVVPPEWLPTDRISRLLVPLDSTQDSARAVEELVCGCSDRGTEVVAVHVFAQDTVPKFWDGSRHEAEAWAREFLSRFVPVPGARAELRRGPAGQEILDVAAREQADLIVLAWSQDFSGGRAELVREVLSNSAVPVILVPLAHAAASRSASSDRPRPKEA